MVLKKKYLLHICRDGTITYRTGEEKVFNGKALPFYSVDTEEEAKELRTMLCKVEPVPHPKLPRQDWFRLAGFSGKLEDLNKVTLLFAKTHATMQDTKKKKRRSRA